MMTTAELRPIKFMTLKKIPFVILVISLSLISCKVGKQDSAIPVPQEIETSKYRTVADITENDIHWHIGVLASDSMQGRKSASPYEVLAAEYIKENFKSLGLKSFNDNYFQTFNVSTRKYFDNCEFYFDRYKAEYPTDFRSMIMFDSLTITSEVVFAGFGYESDYKNINVKGKWVLILEESNSILYERKATAKTNGASGVFVVGIDGTTGAERYVLQSDSTPLIKISHNLADRLLMHAGTAVQEVLSKAKQGENQNINIPVPVTATIKSTTQATTSQNVVAYMKSNNPEYENSYIVIGAHYDHIGTKKVGDSILINNGADDNASGVAGILEIAEKLCSNKEFKYNVIFAAFGAEEMGLIGSSFFCNNSPVPLEKMKLMINLDMVGRLDSNNNVYINTGKPNDKLSTVVDVIKDSHPNINPVFSFESYMQGSDHTSFYSKKIPVLFFLTGLHDDYHKPSDKIETINYKGEKLLLDFVYDIVISPAMDDCIRSFTSSGVSP